MGRDGDGPVRQPAGARRPRAHGDHGGGHGQRDPQPPERRGVPQPRADGDPARAGRRAVPCGRAARRAAFPAGRARSRAARGAGAAGSGPGGLGPELGDPRLVVTPTAVPERIPTDEERYQAHFAGRIQALNDSMAGEAERQRRARDWTITDRNGKKWGINERGPVVNGRNVPIPVPLPVPRSRARPRGRGAPRARAAARHRPAGGPDGARALPARARPRHPRAQRPRARAKGRRHHAARDGGAGKSVRETRPAGGDGRHEPHGTRIARPGGSFVCHDAPYDDGHAKNQRSRDRAEPGRKPSGRTGSTWWSWRSRRTTGWRTRWARWAGSRIGAFLAARAGGRRGRRRRGAGAYRRARRPPAPTASRSRPGRMARAPQVQDELLLLEDAVLDAFLDDGVLSERGIDVGAISEGIVELSGVRVHPRRGDARRRGGAGGGGRVDGGEPDGHRGRAGAPAPAF